VDSCGWGKGNCPTIPGKWDDGRILSGVGRVVRGGEWVSGQLGVGKVGLSYNPGKVGLGVGRYLS
jgi:hypothetical protein